MKKLIFSNVPVHSNQAVGKSSCLSNQKNKTKQKKQNKTKSAVILKIFKHTIFHLSQIAI